MRFLAGPPYDLAVPLPATIFEGLEKAVYEGRFDRWEEAIRRLSRCSLSMTGTARSPTRTGPRTGPSQRKAGFGEIGLWLVAERVATGEGSL